MKAFLNTHLMLSVHLIIIALALMGGAWVAHHGKEVVAETIEANIERQDARLLRLADITDRNDADEIITPIVTDCPNRNAFEDLLSRLDTLSNKELVSVQQLFESCGSFYDERKALMVSRLEREYEVMQDNVDLLKVLREDAALDIRVTKWQALIALERNRSEYLSELTRIQENIITALIAGDANTYSKVQELATNAQQLSQSLTVLGKQIDTLRAELTP